MTIPTLNVLLQFLSHNYNIPENTPGKNIRTSRHSKYAMIKITFIVNVRKYITIVRIPIQNMPASESPSMPHTDMCQS